MKIAGVSWWIWLIGGAVVCGAVAIGLDTAKKVKVINAVPAQTKVDAKRVSADSRSAKVPDVVKATEEINSQAEVCMRAALSVEGAKYSIKEAEDDLEAQRTTGGAQLKAIKLNEAKQLLQENEAKYTEENSKLVALERRYRSVCDFNYSNRIKVFASKANLLGTKSRYAFRRSGYGDPKAKELWDAWLFVSYKSRIQDLDNSTLFPD